MILSCVEESKLKLDDQQIDELLEVLFEGMDTDNSGEIGLDEFKTFLANYPDIAENLSIRYEVAKCRKMLICLNK